MMNSIVVYTQKDMNDLCAILSRNDYVATAYNIVSTTENTCCGKQWRIDYYDPKDVIVNAYSEDIESGVVRYYKPFKDCSELINHCGTKNIWVKSKFDSNCVLQITGYTVDDEGKHCVWLTDSWITLEKLFDGFVFLDDSPCGLEE